MRLSLDEKTLTQGRKSTLCLSAMILLDHEPSTAKDLQIAPLPHSPYRKD
jgi:hypothetical protein